MDQRISDAIHQQKSALCLFVDDDRAFYKKYCDMLTDKIIREKRILEFDNPNRVKVSYEYDIEALNITEKDKDDSITFLFLPDKKKSWLKLYYKGNRLSVASSIRIREHLYDNVVKKDVEELKKTTGYEKSEENLWAEIWKEKNSIPCFVPTKEIEDLVSKGGIIVIEFYDFLDVDKSKTNKQRRLFDEKHYAYLYPKVASGNSWLYIKAPNRFDVNTDYDKSYVEKNDGNDPEISSFTIKGEKAPDVIPFEIAVKVPATLRMWYSSLAWLGFIYILCFIGLLVSSVCGWIKIEQFSIAYAQVGISIIAAIIATRGWLMNEETVLARVSKRFTWIVILIAVLLVAGYTYFMFVS